MTHHQDHPPDFSDLRRRAEAQLETEAITPENLSPAQAARLIHELRVHQIELEMQNDELRLSQARLEESRSKYADLYDFAPVGYLTLDGAGKIVEANLTAATLLGVERSKLLNRFLAHFLAEADRRVFRQLMSNGLHQQERRGDFHLQDGNGGTRVMLLDILFHQDAEGRERARISLTDITELKRTQEELRLHQEELEKLVAERTTELHELNEQLQEANDNLEALFRAAPLAIGVLDDQGRLIKVNPASERIFGWSQAEVQGHLPPSIPPEAPEESLALIQQVLQGNSLLGVELKQQRQDHTCIDVSLSTAPLHDQEGRVRGFVALAEDITQRKHLEESLRQSEALFRAIFANAGIGIATTDLQGRLQEFNGPVIRGLGYAPAELRGMNFRDITYPNDLAADAGLFEELSAGRRNRYMVEKRYVRKDGGVLWGRLHASLVRDQNGEPEFVLALVEDITASRETQAALEESEARYRSLVELSPDAILVHAKGRYVFANPAALKFFGVPGPEDILGQRVLDLVHPDSVKTVRRRVSAGERLDLREVKLLRPDGEPVEVEVAATSVSYRGQPAVQVVVRDITERRQAEREIRRLASFPQLNPNPVLEADEDGQVVYANPAARNLAAKLGLPEGARAFLPPDLKDLFERARQGGPRVYNFDLALKERVYTASLSFPHDLPTARIYALDITERQQAEEALRESREDLNRAQAVAHTGSWRMNVQKNELTWSEENHRIFGISTGTPMTYETFLSTVHPEDRAYVDRKWMAALQGEPYDIEHRLVVGGTVKWVRERAGLEFDPQGQLLGGFGTTQDITERKQAEEALRRAHEELERRVQERTASLRLANEQLLREIEARQQLEDRLRESEARFTAFMEHLPGLAVMRDMEGRYLFANLAWEEMNGLEQGAWQGKTLAEIWPPKQAAALQKLDYKIISSGKPLEQVEMLELADGPHHFLTHRFPIRAQDGLPYMVGSIAIDITARRRAEAALAGHAALVQDLYNQAPCGYHSLDREGYLVQINDTELAWLGYAREEVVGRLKLSDILTPDSRKVFQKSFPQFKDRGWVKDLEYEMVRKDGTVFPVVLSATAVTDEAGNYVMSRSTIFDITDRKRAEQTLKRNEAMLRLILDTLPVGVWLTDREGRIVESNPAARRIWGGARYVGVEEYGEYQGWWADTGKKIEPDDWALARAVRKGETNLGEVINIQCFDGTRKTIINSGVPLFGEDQEILGAIVVNQDITYMVRAEEVIREQARQLEAFFAHGLNPFVFLDREFNFLRVNEAYARACQRPAQDFIGHNHFEFYPDAENQAIFQAVVRSKNPYQVQAKPFEFPDHPEWGVSYWDWSLTPILDQAGEVDFLVFSLRDVTRRVLSEQARNRFIEILEATPDFVGIADYYGRLQYLNRAGRALVGVGEDEDVSRLRVLDLHPQETGKVILAKGVPTAVKEGVWQTELALLHRDGRVVPVSQVVLAHKDARGRVQFFSTIARDISDMKAAQVNLLRQTAIVHGINRIFRETLTCETAPELGQTCLSIAEALTDSRFGFIDTLNDQGDLDALAFSDPGWELCRLTAAREVNHLKNIRPIGLLAKSIREGRAVMANDPVSHPDAAGTPAGHPPLTAYLGIPLVYGGKTLGLLGLGNKEGGYTPADQEAVESLAPAIVEALMHHRAEEGLRGSERKLRHLADQLLTAQENERKRLAAELHDELGHALLSLKLHLSSIEKRMLPEQGDLKEEIRAQLDYIHEVIQEVRRLYHDLSPGDLEDLGLTRALRTLISDFAGHVPQIAWQVDLGDLEGLFSLPVQTIIYRLMQEALTNIGKHANCTEVIIRSKKEPGQVHFVVQDNGAGFDAREFGSRHSDRGLGLVAMEERLNMIGGSFEIQSREQAGTRLSFRIPTLPQGENP
jgi:PAS domain S-box-containing protein